MRARPLALAASLVLVGVGCGATRIDGPDASTDAGPDLVVVDVPASDAPRALHAYTFVLDQLTIDATDDPSVPHTGFNLDQLYSTETDADGCYHQDFFSNVDLDQSCPLVEPTTGRCLIFQNAGCTQGTPGCRGGIDNMFPTLANSMTATQGTDIRGLFADAINHSKLVLLVRVSGIENDLNDSFIEVQLFYGYPLFGTNCTTVTAGREYAVAASSILPGGTSLEDAQVLLPGVIVNGRVWALTQNDSPFQLPMTVERAQIGLTMHGLRLRFDLTPSGISNGSFGGWWNGNDVMLSPCSGTGCSDLQRAFLGGLVDIQQDGVCSQQTASGWTYGGIGLGFGLHGVPAVLSTSTPILATQSPGTCGSVPDPDAGP